MKVLREVSELALTFDTTTLAAGGGGGGGGAGAIRRCWPTMRRTGRLPFCVTISGLSPRPPKLPSRISLRRWVVATT